MKCQYCGSETEIRPLRDDKFHYYCMNTYCAVRDNGLAELKPYIDSKNIKVEGYVDGEIVYEAVQVTFYPGTDDESYLDFDGIVEAMADLIPTESDDESEDSDNYDETRTAFLEDSSRHHAWLISSVFDHMTENTTDEEFYDLLYKAVTGQFQ